MAFWGEGVCSSKILVPPYRTTQYHNPEEWMKTTQEDDVSMDYIELAAGEAQWYTLILAMLIRVDVKFNK